MGGDNSKLESRFFEANERLHGLVNEMQFKGLEDVYHSIAGDRQSISKADVQQHFTQQLGTVPAELFDLLLCAFDKDNDDHIEYWEFMETMARFWKGDLRSRYEQLFNVYRDNNVKVVPKKKLMECLTQLIKGLRGGRVFHFGYYCHVCMKGSLNRPAFRGIRWRCQNDSCQKAGGYDLCNVCYKMRKFNSTHTLRHFKDMKEIAYPLWYNPLNGEVDEHGLKEQVEYEADRILNTYGHPAPIEGEHEHGMVEDLFGKVSDITTPRHPDRHPETPLVAISGNVLHEEDFINFCMQDAKMAEVSKVLTEFVRQLAKYADSEEATT